MLMIDHSQSMAVTGLTLLTSDHYSCHLEGQENSTSRPPEAVGLSQLLMQPPETVHLFHQSMLSITKKSLVVKTSNNTNKEVLSSIPHGKLIAHHHLMSNNAVFVSLDIKIGG